MGAPEPGDGADERDRLAELAALDQLIHWAAFCAQELRQHAAAADVSRIAQLAHTMRGDCAHVAEADALLARLGTLQARARDRTMTEADLKEALAELGCFLDQVRARRDSLSRRPLDGAGRP